MEVLQPPRPQGPSGEGPPGRQTRRRLGVEPGARDGAGGANGEDHEEQRGEDWKASPAGAFAGAP